jgi:hypothetical protein
MAARIVATVVATMGNRAFPGATGQRAAPAA